MKKLFKTMILGAFLASTPSMAFWGNSDSPEKRAQKMEERKAKKMQKILKKLDLTEEQQKKIKALHDNKGKKSKHLVMRQAMDAFHKVLDNPAATDKEITEAHEKLILEKNQHSRDRITHVIELRKILTADQIKKYNEIMKKVRKKMHKKFGPWKDL